jgi:hypothetical protein
MSKVNTSLSKVSKTFDLFVGISLWFFMVLYRECNLLGLLHFASSSMFCPSMCSGKGICDWSLPTPACKCFDETDTTPGCYDSAVNEQAICPTSASSSFKGSTILMVKAVAPVVVLFLSFTCI